VYIYAHTYTYIYIGVYAAAAACSGQPGRIEEWEPEAAGLWDLWANLCRL